MALRLVRFALLLAPALVLLCLAMPRLITGLALDAAFPVPAGMATNRTFSTETYEKTGAVLAASVPGDGETRLLRAQALWLAGRPASEVRPLAEQALQRAPASIQGWMLLSEVALRDDPAMSARALSVALELSPYDYWLVGRKTRAGASLWDRLDPVAQKSLLTQATLIWVPGGQKSELLPLVRAPGGAALLTRAITSDNEIRAINRFISSQRRSRR
jgi:hypothetical protein